MPYLALTDHCRQPAAAPVAQAQQPQQRRPAPPREARMTARPAAPGGPAAAPAAPATGGGAPAGAPALKAPTSIKYPHNPVRYAIGKNAINAVMDNKPTFEGGAPTSYTIEPELPAGLQFNNKTGAIWGSPTIACAERKYTVTATNAAGSVKTEVSITCGEEVRADSMSRIHGLCCSC